jgi:hypothetical protein
MRILTAGVKPDTLNLKPETQHRISGFPIRNLSQVSGISKFETGNPEVNFQVGFTVRLNLIKTKNHGLGIFLEYLSEIQL